MKAALCLFIAIAFINVYSYSQDTFSIVAVDTITGEVGSAGASCLQDSDITGGVLIISDVHPGKGVIHTQAWYININQINARNRMNAGDSPQQIIDWLIVNDAQGDPSKRQYGIVDMDGNGNPRTAAYTGASADTNKNHILGPNYSIQGNTLLSNDILDSMEAGFLNTKGSLAHKLMAALQGANVPGADWRCLGEGVSSQSAFCRVAVPGDTMGTYCMDLIVVETPWGAEPIDSVQLLFDEYMANSPPIALFGYSATVLTAYFNNVSVNSNRWAWDFGDGSSSNLQNPSHVYDSSGTFLVCLTAYDDCVSNTVCASVQVSSVGLNENTKYEKVKVFPNPAYPS